MRLVQAVRSKAYGTLWTLLFSLKLKGLGGNGGFPFLSRLAFLWPMLVEFIRVAAAY